LFVSSASATGEEVANEDIVGVNIRLTSLISSGCPGTPDAPQQVVFAQLRQVGFTCFRLVGVRSAN
jgi:hypothetical protein